jgi:subtilisin family serine protease
MLRPTLRAVLLAALILSPVFDWSAGPRWALGTAAWADDGGDGGDGAGDGGGDGGSGGGDGGPESQVFGRFFAGESARNEIVAARVTPAQLAALTARGYEVLERRRSDLLPTTVVRLRVPLRIPLEQAIDEVEQLNPDSVADRNHYYRYASVARCDGPHCAARRLIEWPVGGDRRLGACPQRARVTIGLIDTAVDRNHPALAGRAIEAIALRSADRRPSDPAHGTAVASLLLGAQGSSAPGLLLDARLIAVDAFYRTLLGDERMDVFDLLAAIDELVRRRVLLINFSFAGPPNKLLERSVLGAARRGVVMVAAVGNDGPQAEPRYPAAYAPVIAVTAVRPDAAVYRRAVRGEHVDLAAPGVDVWTARAGTPGGRVQSGTSFAAPFVTAAAALLMARTPGQSPVALARTLYRATRDLGPPGVDPVYGHGLVQAVAMCGARVGASR